MGIQLRRYVDVEWTSEIDALIGTVPDRVISERYGIAVRSVLFRRRKLGKMSLGSVRRTEAPKWSKKLDKLLGTMSDTDLAKLIGTTNYHVRERRVALEVPAFKASPLPAASFPRRKNSVLNKRKELGIAPFHAVGPYEWKASDLKKLGTVPDDELALELGLSYHFVAQIRNERGIKPLRRSQLRWTEEVIKKMGVSSDAAIAAELGCSKGLVCLKRRELGIPSILESGNA